MGKKTRREESRHQSEELFHLRIKILVLSVCELFLGALITRVGYPCRLDDFAKYAWIKWRLFFFKIFEFIAWKSGSLFRVLQNTLTTRSMMKKKTHTLRKPASPAQQFKGFVMLPIRTRTGWKVRPKHSHSERRPGLHRLGIIMMMLMLT